MKRPRSYGDDLHDAFASGGERPGGSSWQRRDPQDADRSAAGPPSSHYRRPSSLYSKESSSRKGTSAAPSSHDDDREAARRKRFDHDADVGGFDRRKGGFDQYRDASGQRLSSSPRGSSYGGGGGGGRGSGERMMYRSESFSVLRREFPKGFRSERDRSRREGSGGSSSGSSWSRRSSIWKEGSSASVAAVEESKKSPSMDSDSVGRRSRPATPTEDRRGMEDRRGKAKYRDSSSGEQRSLRRLEVVKVEGRSAVSCRSRANDSSSEMEEGELEPDPGLEPATEASNDEKASTLQLEPDGKCIILQQDDTLETKKSETIEELTSDKKSVVHGEGNISVMAEMKSMDVAMDEVTPVAAAAPDNNKIGIQELVSERKEGTIGNADESDILESKLCLDEQEVAIKKDNNSSLEAKDNESRKKVDELEPLISVGSPLLVEKLQASEGEDGNTEAKAQGKKKEETDQEIEVEEKEHRGIDLEAEPDGVSCAAVLINENQEVVNENKCHGETGLFDSINKVVGEASLEGVTLTLMPDKPKENFKDKGKNLEISISCVDDSVPEVHTMAGPSGRGFEWVFKSDFRHQENSQSAGARMGKQNDEKLKMETLDLSLSLPGGLLEQPTKQSKAKPDSSSLARSVQSMPSSFRTGSDGFTTSISLTNSQTFVHNPSCSLTQNSVDNYENSVGSRPLFQGVDQVSNAAIWQAQSSNDAKQNRAIPLQRVLLNENSSHTAFHNINGEHQSKPNGFLPQTSLSRPVSPPHNHGSRDTRSEYSKDKRVLTRERSSSGLFRREQQEGEQLVLNGAGVTEKILLKIVSEPLHLNSRMLQDMTEQSVAYLKETICEILMDLDKSRQIHLLQQALQRRSDIFMDTLTKCSRVLLEILVSIKTGLPDFIQRSKGISSSDLADIFLNLKCCNLACLSVLPVEDCDCKVCTQRTGFCSACMCLVCSKFDNASNTCSWVGCDLCLHWCHTDCGLRESHIRNARSGSNLEMTEMQFHCIACGHPSEMFGFVKEVFKSCAKEWKAETLVKELQYVRRIFSASTDVRGKTLCNVAEKMLMKFENKANHSEVVAYILAFLSESESNVGNSLLLPSKEPTRVDDEGSKVACSSKDVRWLQSVPQEKAHLLENAGVVSSMDYKKVSRTTREIEIKINTEKKPIVDELENVVRFKQAEAKMYQERADAARREADGLKRIAAAKSVQNEEEFSNRIGKLQLDEVKERRKQKFEELQAIERSNHEYFSMKNRMEADIKDLLLKMEATRRNLNT